MNIIEIVVDKNRKLEVKSSPQCTVGDLIGLAGCLISEITNQTGKPTKTVLIHLTRAMKKSKVWKK